MPHEYGKLEEQFLDLFSSETPNFELAKELLSQGVDINKRSAMFEESNILSDCINKITNSWGVCDDCNKEQDNCSKTCSKYIRYVNSNRGENLEKTIKFFIDNGFDVNADNGVQGARALFALVTSTYDTHMINASKILFDAGAKNCVIESEDEESTPLDYVRMKHSYEMVCEQDYKSANLFATLTAVYKAAEENRDYSGIYTYEKAINKKIKSVFAKPDKNEKVFYQTNLPNEKTSHYFNTDLFFVYDTGVLILKEYGSVWTDTLFDSTELVDVSNYFLNIVGSTINQITFNNKPVEFEKGEDNPIVCLAMSSGAKLTVKYNLGEIKYNSQAIVYYTIN